MGLVAGPGLLFVPPDRFRNMPRAPSPEAVRERDTSAVLPASEQHIVITPYCFGCAIRCMGPPPPGKLKSNVVPEARRSRWAASPLHTGEIPKF